jgi:hypothetical protein
MKTRLLPYVVLLVTVLETIVFSQGTTHAATDSGF